MNRDDVQTFDPSEPYSVFWRRLPHWTQAGTMCFITWRTADSMPRHVVERWVAERNDLLQRSGIIVDAKGYTDGGRVTWRDALKRLPIDKRFAIKFALTERFDAHLDDCHGECLLRLPELAQVVADSLKKFDGDRYQLTDFVVMPNHVHLLAAFADGDAMLSQCASWKRFTAREINRRAKRRGALWQRDGFDHLVRSVEHFEKYRRYIARNGPKAGLGEDEHVHYSTV